MLRPCLILASCCFRASGDSSTKSNSNNREARSREVSSHHSRCSRDWSNHQCSEPKKGIEFHFRDTSQDIDRLKLYFSLDLRIPLVRRSEYWLPLCDHPLPQDARHLKKRYIDLEDPPCPEGRAMIDSLHPLARVQDSKRPAPVPRLLQRNVQETEDSLLRGRVALHLATEDSLQFHCREAHYAGR